MQTFAFEIQIIFNPFFACRYQTFSKIM